MAGVKSVEGWGVVIQQRPHILKLILTQTHRHATYTHTHAHPSTHARVHNVRRPSNASAPPSSRRVPKVERGAMAPSPKSTGSAQIGLTRDWSCASPVALSVILRRHWSITTYWSCRSGIGFHSPALVGPSNQAPLHTHLDIDLHTLTLPQLPFLHHHPTRPRAAPLSIPPPM